jgi:multisubunit Na+/H+ antiporter MnhG subunit
VTARHLVAVVLLVAGCSLQVLAVLGLLVMRSTLDRLHYVGMAAYGALLVAVAIVARQSFSLIGDKALAAGVLLVGVGAVLVHQTARSLRMREHGDWRSGAPREPEETS